jgi:large subunit ribosomal protein L21
MNKAVIATGGKQYIVKEGDVLDVELLKSDKKTLTLEPLMVINEKEVKIGRPIVESSKVEAKIIDTVKDDKVISIRYKAKKRVNKIRGHRQIKSKIQITRIK